jgi:hypothetical protein
LTTSISPFLGPVLTTFFFFFLCSRSSPRATSAPRERFVVERKGRGRRLKKDLKRVGRVAVEAEWEWPLARRLVLLLVWVLKEEESAEEEPSRRWKAWEEMGAETVGKETWLEEVVEEGSGSASS